MKRLALLFLLYASSAHASYSPPVYGSMNITSTQTITISVAATPVQVGTFSAGVDLSNTSYASNELTVNVSGVYKISANVSANKASGAAARVTKGYLYLDDGTPAAIPGCAYERTLSATNDVGSATINCLVELAAGDKIELWIENTDNTENIEVQAANVVVSRKN